MFKKAVASLDTANTDVTLVTGPAVVKSIEVTASQGEISIVTFKINTTINKKFVLTGNDTFGDDFVHVLESGDKLVAASTTPVTIFVSYATEGTAQ